MATKTQVGNWFRSQLGYKEGKNNNTKYAKPAGHANGYAWCATFLVAGFRSRKMTLGNESAYTPSLLNSLKEFEIDGPQVGAIAFLYFPDLGRVAHAGWVESVRSDGRFVTIEGNTDVAGGRTGGQVMRKVRSRSGFTFVMPKYDPEPKPYYGDCKKLQKALRLTVDNHWGPETDKAANAVRAAFKKEFPYGVKYVQRVVGTTDDGAWGAVSRKALQRTTLDVQTALIDMSHVKFPRSGFWDQPTEEAYNKVRKICRRP